MIRWQLSVFSVKITKGWLIYAPFVSQCHNLQNFKLYVSYFQGLKAPLKVLHRAQTIASFARSLEALGQSAQHGEDHGESKSEVICSSVMLVVQGLRSASTPLAVIWWYSSRFKGAIRQYWLQGPAAKKAKFGVDHVAYVDDLPAVIDKWSPSKIHVLEGVNCDRYTVFSTCPPDTKPQLQKKIDTYGFFLLSRIHPWPVISMRNFGSNSVFAFLRKWCRMRTAASGKPAKITKLLTVQLEKKWASKLFWNGSPCGGQEKPPLDSGRIEIGRTYVSWSPCIQHKRPSS